jgi:hypothetical protein
MLQAPATRDEVERKARWDAFLDAYSAYLREPSLGNAAELHLAGVALETADETFSMGDFETSLGWNLENA